MATADQLKALIKSFREQDSTRFYRVALQLAAHEARLGHGKLAGELRELIDWARAETSSVQGGRRPIPITKPRGELEGLLSVSYPDLHLKDMVLPSELKDIFQRILKEHLHQHRLLEHGLSPRRKFLLLGPPGTGKSMAAKVLAGELHLPLFIVRFEALITKFMGETAAKLRLIFDAMHQTRGVYLFDEFDAIGAQRAMPNETGEIRRVLNSFLQFIEEDNSLSIIIAATNHMEILDRALFRRFDDVIRFDVPLKELIVRLLQDKLAPYGREELDWNELAGEAVGLSYGDLVRACEDAVKDMVLEGRKSVTRDSLRRALRSRKDSLPSRNSAERS
ncbi:MAG TPA: ATP-binding protein [Thermoanaerobaculia bacterium]